MATVITVVVETLLEPHILSSVKAEDTQSTVVSGGGGTTHRRRGGFSEPQRPPPTLLLGNWSLSQ